MSGENEPPVDLQCNPQIVNGALGKLGAARPDCVYPVVLMLLSRACGRFRPTGERGDGGKIDRQSGTAFGERLDDFPDYVCFPTPQRLVQPTRRH